MFDCGPLFLALNGKFSVSLSAALPLMIFPTVDLGANLEGPKRSSGRLLSPKLMLD